ncbi:MAG: tRNA threonylcarbamoyladenosine dehydratase [Lautropia sp.]|nr:tRNA threonylcarbamoyladenosine dehydratase [Lautropia sp.]
MSDRRFASVARVFGEAACRQLWDAHVVVVGIGGVGSWAAEALARSGVGHLTLIDLDHIAESNINRQVHALTSTLGAAKCEVMAARIRDISPDITVNAVDEFVEPGQEDVLIPGGADVVIDAIDAVAAKASLIAWCVAHGRRIISCGAAGGRRDPLQLQVQDLAHTSGDALLSSVRARLRRHHGFARASTLLPAAKRTSRTRSAPPFGVMAVYSPEQISGLSVQPGLEAGMPLACAGYGSLVTVTAAMGLVAAGRAMTWLTSRPTTQIKPGREG